MPEEDLVDIKFRLYDGSDIGPFSHSSTSTVDMLKQRVVSDWPKGKTMIPKTWNEVKLMCSGKILENSKTVGQCKLPFGDVGGGGVMVMHVVVQPTIDKAKSGPKHTRFQLWCGSDDTLCNLPKQQDGYCGQGEATRAQNS